MLYEYDLHPTSATDATACCMNVWMKWMTKGIGRFGCFSFVGTCSRSTLIYLSRKFHLVHLPLQLPLLLLLLCSIEQYVPLDNVVVLYDPISSRTPERTDGPSVARHKLNDFITDTDEERTHWCRHFMHSISNWMEHLCRHFFFRTISVCSKCFYTVRTHTLTLAGWQRCVWMIVKVAVATMCNSVIHRPTTIGRRRRQQYFRVRIIRTICSNHLIAFRIECHGRTQCTYGYAICPSTVRAHFVIH